MERIKILRKNGGFTLVELVISFAILAVIGLMVALIIRTSGNTYSGISTDINLQYESQTAMSQIQEYVLDCNAYIGTNADGSALYVFNKTDATHYQAYKITLAAPAGELYLYNKTITASSFDPSDTSNYAFGTGQLMSSFVKQFTAAVSTDARSVDVAVNYGAGSKTFNGRQMIALRNQVTTIVAPA